MDLNFDSSSQPQGGLITTSEEQTQSPLSFTAEPTIVDDVPAGSVIANVSVSTDFGEAPLTVDFDASASEGSNLTYEWHFGDEASPDTISATGVTTTHTYTTEGDYTAVLTVTDDVGTSQQAEVALVAFSPPPDPNTETVKANLTVDPPVGTAPTEVYFSAFDSEGTDLTYQWNFGDGNTGEGVFVSHLYDTPGNYPITLTITNSVGRNDEVQSELLILPEPRGLLAARGVKGNRTIELDAGDPIAGLTYEWDLGDGNTASSSQLSHTYTELGTYTIKLTIKDNRGLSTSSNLATNSNSSTSNHSLQTLAVEEIVYEEETWATAWDSPPEASFTMNNLGNNDEDGTFYGLVPVTMAFDATSSQGEGTLTYDWDFGDGNTAQGVQVNHTFTDEGFFLVTLTVTNENNLSDQYQAFVKAKHPAADIRAILRYPNLSTQAVLLNDTFPYVIHQEASVTNFRAFPIASPCSLFAAYFNGTAIAASDYLTGQVETLIPTYCDFMLIKASAFSTPLPAQANSELRVVTSQQDLRYELDIIAGVRVPKIYISVLPDHFIPGQEASPHINEYTTTNTTSGEEELMMTVHIRESELDNGLVEFEVPIYAVDATGNLATEANGYFYADFDQVNSDCGDCVMVDGKSTIKIRALVASETQLDLTDLTLYSKATCGIDDTSPYLYANLHGCVTTETSNLAPVGIANIPIFEYPLSPAVIAAANGITFGIDYDDRSRIDKWLSDLDHKDVWGFAKNFVPFYGDGEELLQQVKNGLSGEGVNWTLIGLSTAGLLLDVVTGGVADVTGPLKAAYKISQEAAEKGGSRLFADALDEAADASLSTRRGADDFIDDVKVREPELYDLVSTTCGLSLNTSSLTTLATSTKQSNADCIKIAQDLGQGIIDEFGTSSSATFTRAQSAVVRAEASGVTGDTFLIAFDNVRKKNLSTKDFLETWEDIADIEGAGEVVIIVSKNTDGAVNVFKELQHGHILKQQGWTIEEFPSKNFDIDPNGNVVRVDGIPKGSVDVDSINRSPSGVLCFDDVKTGTVRASELSKAQRFADIARASNAQPRYVLRPEEPLDNGKLNRMLRRFCPVLDVVSDTGISLCNGLSYN